MALVQRLEHSGMGVVGKATLEPSAHQLLPVAKASSSILLAVLDLEGVCHFLLEACSADRPQRALSRPAVNVEDECCEKKPDSNVEDQGLALAPLSKHFPVSGLRQF